MSSDNNDEKLIMELLSKDEGVSIIDFKSKAYHLDNDHYKALFIKDVICMANTPRDGSAYILIGVRRKPDGSKEIVGVKEHPDDANLQQLVNSRVRPVPKFQYRAVQYKGAKLGILEMFPRRGGPFMPTWGYENKLRQNVIYFRRGSSNSEARAEEFREIVDWMNMTSEETAKSGTPRSIKVSNWDKFYGACNKFDEGWIYVLVVGPNLPVSKERKAALGRIDWSLVLDFDPETHTSGLYSSTESELKTVRALHLLTLQNRISFSLMRGTYWIAGFGLKDVPTTLVDDNWRTWHRRYSEDLRYTARSFAKAASERPITFVILWDEPDYIRTICESFDGTCGNSVNFVFGVEDTNRVGPVAQTFGAQSVPITFADICNGLERMTEKRPLGTDVRLPTLESGPTAIPQDRLRWLEEDLELIHLDSGQTPEPNCNPRKDFLQGKLISWVELAMHCDIDRDKTGILQGKIEYGLDNRGIRRNFLYHWPGAGGSTVARRIVWNLHYKYPTVRLLRIAPNETIERLRAVFDLTTKPLLVLVEGSDISMTAFDQLFNEALSRQLPSIYLIVLRVFAQREADDNTVFLDSTLSISESRLFAQSYSAIQPDRRTQLESLVHSRDAWQRNPFYFGLTAFGKDFLSIGDYVSRRLQTGTDVQKQILVFLAIAYHYGQKAIPAQMFAGLLSLPEKRIVRLENVLPEPLRELSIREEQFRWRPAHELIAGEIMESILQGSATDRRVWRQNLSTWASKLIDMPFNPDKVPSDELTDILSSIFILREHVELLGSSELSSARRYAPIIEDIPSPEGRLGVFKKLVEAFPNEPHFWGHLGRFYAIELRKSEEALTAIDNAIRLDDQNNVFYHMKGMVLRQQVYDMLEKCNQRGECSYNEYEDIKRKVEDAGEQFEKSRSLAAPQEEHAYVSHIQLLIRTIDFGFAMSQKSSKEEFLVSRDSAWYRDLLDISEHLLEECKRKQEGEQPGYYITRCQAGLNELYGDYSRVLEGWNSLLDQKDVYLPPVRRQIARVYLLRKNRSWDGLDQRELGRVAQLMQENIETDTTDYRSIRFWFQAVRRTERQSIETTIERLSYWKATSQSIEATFYLYILHVLQALDGSIIAVSKASDLIKECSQMARTLAIRHNSIEWYGKGVGMKRILYHTQLPKAWEEEFEKGDKLSLVEGRIARIFGPGAGNIELSCGLSAFFVPGRGFGRTYGRSQDENKAVRFYLSFSYDGLRAWAVRDA